MSDAARMTLARLDDLEPLRIGVTGHRVLAGARTGRGRHRGPSPGSRRAIRDGRSWSSPRSPKGPIVWSSGRPEASRLAPGGGVLPLPKFDFPRRLRYTRFEGDFLRLIAQADYVTGAPGVRHSRGGLRRPPTSACSTESTSFVRSGTRGRPGRGRKPPRSSPGPAPAACRSPGFTPAPQAGTMKPRSLADQGSVSYENL